MDILLDNSIVSPNFNDLALVNNDLALIGGASEILQHVLQNLRTFRGEWFLDNTVGVPYFQQILVKNVQLGNVDALIQSTINKTPGVTALTKYSSKIDTVTRQIFITFQAQTTSGTVNYTGLV